MFHLGQQYNSVKACTQNTLLLVTFMQFAAEMNSLTDARDLSHPSQDRIVSLSFDARNEFINSLIIVNNYFHS